MPNTETGSNAGSGSDDEEDDGYEAGCPTCHEVFDDYDYQYCDWCLDWVDPVPKFPDTKCFVHPEHVVVTSLECDTCGDMALCRGGDDVDERLMTAWCCRCRAERDLVYADRREAFCCKDCRQEREISQLEINSWHDFAGKRDRWARVFADWCRGCDAKTDTGKVDSRAYPVHCCAACRAEWEGDREPDEPCSFCGDDEYEPVEVDDD